MVGANEAVLTCDHCGNTFSVYATDEIVICGKCGTGKVLEGAIASVTRRADYVNSLKSKTEKNWNKKEIDCMLRDDLARMFSIHDGGAFEKSIISSEIKTEEEKRLSRFIKTGNEKILSRLEELRNGEYIFFSNADVSDLEAVKSGLESTKSGIGRVIDKETENEVRLRSDLGQMKSDIKSDEESLSGIVSIPAGSKCNFYAIYDRAEKIKAGMCLKREKIDTVKRKHTESYSRLNALKAELKSVEDELKIVKDELSKTPAQRVEEYYQQLKRSASINPIYRVTYIVLAMRFGAMNGYKDTDYLADDCVKRYIEPKIRRTRYETKQQRRARYQQMAKDIMGGSMIIETDRLANECEKRYMELKDIRLILSKNVEGDFYEEF